MLIHYNRDQNIFIADCQYIEKDIVKAANFRWNPSFKYWWTEDPINAKKLVQYCSEDAKEELERALGIKQEIIDMSSATDADIEIPVPNGLSYLPFQKAGIKFCVSKFSNPKNLHSVLISDQPGLGKTIQSIGVINIDSSIQKVLVICPASLKINWHRELDKWLTKKMSISVLDQTWIDADIVVVNYDRLKKFDKNIKEIPWDILIVDECHMVRNRKTIRSHYIFGHKGTEKFKDENGKELERKVEINPINAKKKLFLTGTPIVNRPAELWNIISHLDPVTWNKWFFYMQRYCAAEQTRFGWDVSGADNLDELHLKLRSTLMLRRLKADVLKELPAKRRQVIIIPSDDNRSQIQKEKDVQEVIKKKIQALRIAVELAKASDNDEDYIKAVKALNSSNAVAFSEMARVRHETAILKVPYVVEHIKNVLEEEDKVVVFAHHHDVMDAMFEQLKEYGCVKLTGKDNEKEKQKAVDKFQENKKTRIFIGSIQASGVGITLTASHHVVFAELDWVPGVVSQCEDRCHRIGTTEQVLIQHVVLEDSMDENMANRLVEKQEVIDKALDKNMMTIEQATKAIDVETIKKAEQETIGEGDDEFMTDVDKAASTNVKKEQVAKEAEKISEVQVKAIHQALKTLAGLDIDRAGMVNDIGFNRIDGEIGHQLAERDMLTKKQAVIGRRIVLKYHKQLNADLVDKIKGK